MPGDNSPFIVVIGTSAGGLKAIHELASRLPTDLNAAILVVLHLSKTTITDILINRLQKGSSLPCKVAEQGEGIRTGTLYVASADAHLLIKDDKLIIGNGPPENRFRPSIDVLFRSAAVNYKEKVIGIILTGFLNDGTSGMWAIKQSGGYCIVQDPNEAEYPDMPLAVLEKMDVDEVLSLKDIPAALLTRTEQPLEKKQIKPPEIVIKESMISEKAATAIINVADLGEKSLYACPECGGGLWLINDKKIKHYRCHVGHSFSEEDLVLRQQETIEQTVWVAIRMMEERKAMLMKMYNTHIDKGLTKIGAQYQDRAVDLEDHIQTLKELLFSLNRA